MNIMQFFLSPSIQALGWTLLNSIWQGLACLIIVLFVFRCVPSNRSGVRYAVATAALLFMLVLSLFTFVYLNDSLSESTVETTSIIHYSYPIQNLQPENNYISGVLNAFTATLQYYLPFIVICWCFGMMLFTMRLSGGWLKVQRLRASGIPVEEQWNKRMRILARKLNVNQLVILAESAMTEAPVVIGYFKPMILIPLGMLGGLSTEQLESIIAHELIHIRRRDYLVNLVQSVLEILYFFNPFVWVISGIIRREREHCCDDAVIALHGNPLAYAHALTALEEARLSRAGIALSLAEDKNQLLNRIKRIMEKSVRTYSLRDRIVPAILLVTGLICASWLTINSTRTEGEHVKPSTLEKAVVSVDTTIKIEKSGRYYRKSITTIGDDGKPREEVIEEYEGDDVPAVLSNVFDFPLTIVTPDAFAFNVPPYPAIPPIEVVPSIPAFPALDIDINIALDTLPVPAYPGFGMDLEEWGKQFETKFRESFGCMVNLPDDELLNSALALTENMELNLLQSNLAELQHEEIWARHEEQMKTFSEQVERWSEENAKNFEQLEKSLQELEHHGPVFDKEFRDELVKDGYLDKEEDLESIEINDDAMKVNGKEIEQSDLKKYRELIKKNSHYFSVPHPPHPGGRRE